MRLLKGCSRGRHGLFDRGDRGATAVEYGLMASLIALVIVAAVTTFGRSVSGLFQLAVDQTPFFH